MKKLKASNHAEIDGFRTFAALVGLGVERDFLIVGETCQAGRLDGRNVHKHIRAAAIGGDKAEALVIVEKFDRAVHLAHGSPVPLQPQLRGVAAQAETVFRSAKLAGCMCQTRQSGAGNMFLP